MELKTNYQYTYFVHPFAVKESKYRKFLLKLIRDDKCKLKTFQKEKDLKLYKYFSPKVREFMFSSFGFSKNKINKLEKLPDETKAAVLSENSCVIFEYNYGKEMQGKTEATAGGIFFKVQKIEIICFKTGINFLTIKTNIEDDTNFSSVLNFNYKFRDINQKGIDLNRYENIKIQAGNFEDVEKFPDFIRKITGSSIETLKLNIDTERFLMYTYACIDSRYWDKNNGFDITQNQYLKLVNAMPADLNVSYEENQIATLSKWKFAKLGITKNVSALYTSTAEMNNYTILPDEFENQYFYTYILNLYKNLYLKKLNLEIMKSENVKKARESFVDFTRNLWIQEVTEDEIGSSIDNKYREVFQIDEIYYRIKNEYDVLYKELNIEKSRKSTSMIAIILIVTLIVNLLSLLAITWNG